MNVEVRIRRLPHGEGLPPPSYATGGSAGADLYAAVESELGAQIGKLCEASAALRDQRGKGREAITAALEAVHDAYRSLDGTFSQDTGHEAHP